MNQREIKFRAWDKKAKKYHQVFPKWKISSDGIFECLGDENIVIQQSTGLKDKNGKEIYEGDIIKTDEFGDEIAEVWFSEQGMWIFGNKEKQKGEVFLDKSHYEVIGNIYENPELLNI